MAASMTRPSTGCCEYSMHIDGKVVGRSNFSFLEEVILELASEWAGVMGERGEGQQVQKHGHTSQGPSWREELVEALSAR